MNATPTLEEASKATANSSTIMAFQTRTRSFPLLSTVTLALVSLTACEGEHGHDHEHGAGGDHADHRPAADLPGSTITHFTRSPQDQSETELFVEFRPLIVGEETAFAAHFTDCGPLWTAVGEGDLTVELVDTEGETERFSVDSPTVPGIFRPVAKPTTAGTRTLRFVLQRGKRTHTHDVGRVEVYANRAAAEKALGHAEEEDDGSISFLKEQAWKLNFALTEVKTQKLSPTLRVFGQLLPRSDGQARVSAPASGRLVSSAEGLPTVGSVVERGAVLAYLVPSVSGGGNLAAILLQKEKATLAANVAQREVDRMTTLFAQGAIASRRVDQAKATLARAKAEIAGANRLLAQHQGSVSAGRAPGGVKVVAPIRGVLTSVPVVAGSYVEEGETLFEVVDTSVLWLAARIPESQRRRATRVFGGAFRTADGEWRRFEESVEGYQPSAVLDESDRTFALRIPIDNADSSLSAGTHLTIDLAVAPATDALAVPVSAVVYEQGVEVVYVMTEGESFERRVLKSAGEQGALIAATAGVTEGERVVSTGAMYVKLSSMSGAAPAHGHAH